MMSVIVVPCVSVEQSGWLAMRQALWPQACRERHLGEMAAFLAEPERYCQFIAHLGQNVAAGFVEASLRSDYVNGTTTAPVGFLEGIYVKPPYRRSGIAGCLVAAVERWARQRGCREFASDALIANEASHAVHRALGFEETERVVFFRKFIG
jgi:aminoglycoside 6'-N-acetyltransferase I